MVTARCETLCASVDYELVDAPVDRHRDSRIAFRHDLDLGGTGANRGPDQRIWKFPLAAMPIVACLDLYGKGFG